MASFNLAQTQRGRVLDIIRSDQRDEHDRTIGTVDDIVLENMNEPRLVKCDKNGDGEENKTNCCCLKGIMVCLTILAVLAVTLGLVIYKRNHFSPDRRGSITDVDHDEIECKDVRVALGSDIKISCTINKGTWREDKLPEKIIAFHENSALNLQIICNVTNRDVTCAASRSNCSSAGNFDVKFYSSDRKDASVLFTKTVFVNITAPTDQNVKTIITQECMNDGIHSVFHLSCSYANDCNSYEILLTANDTVLSDCSSPITKLSNFDNNTVIPANSSNGDGSCIMKWCKNNTTSFIYKSGEKLLCPIMNQTGSSSQSSPLSSSTTLSRPTSTTMTPPNSTSSNVTISSPRSTAETVTVVSSNSTTGKL